jgi:Na+-transporting NADH:ubiquinone oxidoreductase subunit NqrF
MANLKTIFLGAKGTGTEENELECFCNLSNRISITILDELFNNNGYPSVIELDKNTAIRFSKELKKQISLIEESEVNNG